MALDTSILRAAATFSATMDFQSLTIASSSSNGTVVRGGKVPMLRALTTALVGADGGGGTETEAAVRAAPRVLFFDDDEKNVTGAREHGYVMSVLTDACFTREKWDEVKAGLGMEAFMDGA